MTQLRDVVVDRWRALEVPALTSSRTMVTSPTPVETPQGPVLLGIDTSGSNHLLVPLAPRQSVEPDLTGRAIHLFVRPLEDSERYQHFADLALVDPSLLDVFTSLCEDVLAAVAAAPERAVRALRRVLDEWRQLLAGAQGPLGTNELAGLFGELTVLRDLLQRNSGLAESWHGPDGTAKDFYLDGNAIEVKTTTAPEGRTIRVHGVDQLEPPAGGRLYLVWFRLAQTESGVSVPELVDRVLDLADHAAHVRRGLAVLGYRERDTETYAAMRYLTVERRCYAVKDGFPRIVSKSLIGDALRPGVDDLVYSVDLTSPEAIEREVADFMSIVSGAS